MAAQPKLGSGGRFAAIKANAAKEYAKKGKSPAAAEKIGGAIAASIGRKRRGNKKMAQLSSAGKKSSSFSGNE